MDTITVQSATSKKWYEIWWVVWTHPGANTFRDILHEPEVNASRGFKWVAISVFILSLGSLLVLLGLSSEVSPTQVCNGLSAPIGAAIGLAISAGIYHGIARLFGGSGKWDRLVFCFAAVQAPVYLLGVVGVLLPSVCEGLVALVLSIYSIVLNIAAIDAVEDIGTGKSIATLFAPGVVLVILAICLMAGIIPALSN